ncbi:hypothetical protein [Pseudomonas sp. NPDC007930]|uniref:hypothetical protein n=1 Tax=Pseudomonas sp. NPDC007930 TaxID=3364417 RepID=UPI0036E9C505
MTPLLALLLGAPLLAGCSAPTAHWRYVEFDAGGDTADYSGLGKFTLAKSILLLRPVAQGTPPALLSLPAEASGAHTQFGFQPQPGSPAPRLATLDSTRLVRSLSLAKGNEPAAAPPAQPVAVAASIDRGSRATSANPPALPMAVDVQTLLPSAQRGAGSAFAVVENSGYKVALQLAFDAVPAGAIETAQLDLNKASGLYFYSACRAATLTLLSEPFKQQQYTVTIADPNFVQTVALAPGSAVTSHSSCGVDLGGGSEDASALAALNQAVAQARSVARAWETVPMPTQAQALAEARATQKAVVAVRKSVAAAKAAAAAEAAEQRRQEETLRSAEVVPQPASPRRETFAF